MSQKLEISETGLKLIKAFEGYRPVDRELVSGQRIVGYGHRLYSEDAVMMSKSEAEEVLRTDLEPFEDMINTQVHAPITQSQFDALCSFAFNIGPKAFLKSDTLRALNNGRPLDAANGFDVWRKSDIAGKTYVVDALMRRRTAEKALFLLTDRNLPAGREDLPPVKDTTIEGLSTEDAYPIFTANDAETIVASAPYSAKISPARRKEDGPSGVLELSALDIIDDEDLPQVENQAETIRELGGIAEGDENQAPVDLEEAKVSDALDDSAQDSEDDEADALEKTEVRTSPIAAAASDIVARLDALIEDADEDISGSEKDWPETLIGTSDAEETDALDISDEMTSETFDDEALETETVMEDEPTSPPNAKVIDLRSRTQRSEPERSAAAQDEVKDLPQASPLEEKKPVAVIDELAADDVLRPRTDSAAKYIENYSPAVEPLAPQQSAKLGLWIPVLLGFILLGAAGGAWVRGAELLLGPWGPIITYTGVIIGAGLILAGVYAYARKLTWN